MVGIVLGGGGGKDGVILPTLSNPAVAGNVLKDKDFINAANERVVGTITSKSAQTYTPSTSQQTIAAGQYLSGAQTIAAIPNTYKRFYTTDVNFSSSGNVQIYTVSNLGFTPLQFYMMASDDLFPTTTSNRRLIVLSHDGGSSNPVMASGIAGDSWIVFSKGDSGVALNSGQASIDLSDINPTLYFDNCIYRVVCLG